MHQVFYMCIAGLAAGSINGLLGAGGGMVLVPLLSKATHLKPEQVFPCSVVIILPICIVSLLMGKGTIPWSASFPYLLGSVFGGVAAGIWGRKIPVLWLHRALGLMILWGGVRILC